MKEQYVIVQKLSWKVELILIFQQVFGLPFQFFQAALWTVAYARTNTA
jgi:hypothetical protein